MMIVTPSSYTIKVKVIHVKVTEVKMAEAKVIQVNVIEVKVNQAKVTAVNSKVPELLEKVKINPLSQFSLNDYRDSSNSNVQNN